MNPAPPQPQAVLGLSEDWRRYMDGLRRRAASAQRFESWGTLVRVTGLVLEAAGIRLPVGALCAVHVAGQAPVHAEVVGFAGDRTYLMPGGDVQGLVSGAIVKPLAGRGTAAQLGQADEAGIPSDTLGLRLPMGEGLLGRVVDAYGQPLDPHGPLSGVRSEALGRRPINAMERAPVRQPLDTGVRAINAMLTVGRGQRIGLFAGSGVGKSVLLGMMARYTQADVIVVGLIGERGREVKEFVEDILGAEGLARSVVVAAPADAPPLARLQGANYAAAIAESFRDAGRHVLLLMDSLTRYAMAQREIALAIGEPPATKGYPPSCFAKLPQLVERSGNGLHGVGSITAFYTVLSEGDDQQDPIADASRAILDGHIVLTRELAEAGHYPAIDIEKSASRVMHNVTTPPHQAAARRLRQLQARYSRSRDLLQLGAYVSGQDAELDAALQAQPAVRALLQQDMHEAATLADSVAQLNACVSAR